MSKNSANGSTRRWRELRGEKLARDPLCEWPHRAGKRECPRCSKDIGRYCTEPAVEVDHIVPLKDGGARFDMSNLRSLCADHHKIRHGKRPRAKIDPETGWAE